MPTDPNGTAALIATFAHDLRVPLRSIVMSTQRIQRRPEELSVEIRAKLDEILTAARRQEELISSVVEYDQALDPGLTYDSPLALRLALQTAGMKVDAYRQAKGGVLTFDYDNAPRVQVPAGIARVVEKVLHNALKFHPAGASPVVDVQAAESADGRVSIVIRDNGMGVETQYIPLVFQPFQRLNSPAEFPGSGLGLSTSQRLLHSIGGTIEISGTGGTVVTLSFPKS